MRPRDPIAPVRKRPKRIAKKLAKRCGMLRCRGGSYERFARHANALGTRMAELLNEHCKRSAELFNKHLLPQMTIPNTLNGTKHGREE